MASHRFQHTPIKVPHVSTQSRHIHTAIPAERTVHVLESIQSHETQGMQGALPLVWDKAEGSTITDPEGNRWIDFTSGIVVTNIGHAHPHWVKRLKQALDHPLTHCYNYPNPPRAAYLEKLIAQTPEECEKAFLSSAGTEATEAALKIMRLHALHSKKKKPGIISLHGSFHGRSLGAQMLSGKPEQKSWIGYQDPNIHHMPFPYPWAMQGDNGKQWFEKSIESLVQQGVHLENDLCGVLLESFQGWGACFYPRDYVQAAREFCDIHNLVLCFDEMQAGFGRTGKFFAYQHYDVSANLVCCGKGMGSGFPLAGLLGRASLLDLAEPGEMGSTHSANPLACAAGIATLEVLEQENLLATTQEKEIILTNLLHQLQEKHPDSIWGYLGKGLALALYFHDPSQTNPQAGLATAVAEACFRKGLLVVHTGRETIKLTPPLTIAPEALMEAAQILQESIESIH